MSSEYADRIEELYQAAEQARERFEPPENPPDEERAMQFLREGFGPTVTVYLDARTGGGQVVEFAPEEFERMERAANIWLELYAACYDRDVEPDVPIRTAAELLMDTHNVEDTARVLLDVPPRR